MYYVHKLERELAYGGPEEGGWWYDHETATDTTSLGFDIEEDARQFCYAKNVAERRRRDEDKESYRHGYTSVLAHRDGPYFTYTVTESATWEPEPRPYYC
jgi:hypothetical protein